MPETRPYGFGIVDRHGLPWWEEGCACEDREPLEEVAANLNDPAYQPTFGRDARVPYRVVELVFREVPRSLQGGAER